MTFKGLGGVLYGEENVRIYMPIRHANLPQGRKPYELEGGLPIGKQLRLIADFKVSH